MNFNRREFLQKGTASVTALTALSMGGCTCSQLSQASQSGFVCCNTPDLEPDSLTLSATGLTIDLAKAKSLNQVGTSAAIVNPEKSLQIIIVRAEKKRYVALSRLCTHANQVVSYNPKRKRIQCNNYNHAIFDLEGQVVKGPAPTALKSYPVVLHDGLLEIVL
jgi:Rieske Fe-S protein